jgi:Porin subfamily
VIAIRLSLAAALAALAGPALAQAPQALDRCGDRGPGFAEVPGTATCVKVSGRTVAEAGTGRRAMRSRVGATVSADVRTDTALGPVRGYVRLKTGHGSPREP